MSVESGPKPKAPRFEAEPDPPHPSSQAYEPVSFGRPDYPRLDREATPWSFREKS